MTRFVSKSLKLNGLESLSPFAVWSICQTEQKIVCNSIDQIFVLLSVRKGRNGETGIVGGDKDRFMLGDCVEKSFRI